VTYSDLPQLYLAPLLAMTLLDFISDLR